MSARLAPMDPFDPVMRARSLRSPDEAVAVYREWAADYDHDVFDVLGFTGTDRIAELLAAHLPDLGVPVIDLGCGTGGVAARLRTLGVTTVDGVDISPEMLAVAEGKGFYRSLMVADLTGPIAIPGATYGASVSAGTFTSGHIGAEAVPEALRILRPDAIVAWVLAESCAGPIEAAMAAAGLTTVHRSIEAVRRDGPTESVMLVARLPRSPEERAMV